MPEILKRDITGNLKLFIQIMALIVTAITGYYALSSKLDVIEERIRPIQSAIENLDDRVRYLERLHQQKPSQ